MSGRLLKGTTSTKYESVSASLDARLMGPVMFISAVGALYPPVGLRSICVRILIDRRGSLVLVERLVDLNGCISCVENSRKELSISHSCWSDGPMHVISMVVMSENDVYF